MLSRCTEFGAVQANDSLTQTLGFVSRKLKIVRFRCLGHLQCESWSRERRSELVVGKDHWSSEPGRIEVVSRSIVATPVGEVWWQLLSSEFRLSGCDCTEG